MAAERGVQAHPCLSCGACCATYRVSFYWAECRSGGGAVPDDLTVAVTPHLAAMAGTSQAVPRCVGLEGEVGRSVRCTLYSDRPSPCREVLASWEHGAPDDRCDRARTRYGLAVLGPEDWNVDTFGSNEREET